jgi:chromosome segregation ATPase
VYGEPTDVNYWKDSCEEYKHLLQQTQEDVAELKQDKNELLVELNSSEACIKDLKRKLDGRFNDRDEAIKTLAHQLIVYVDNEGCDFDELIYDIRRKLAR